MLTPAFMYPRSYATPDPSLCHASWSALVHAMQDIASSGPLGRYVLAKMVVTLHCREVRSPVLRSSRVFAVPDSQGTSLPWCRDFARDASNCIPVRPRNNGTAFVNLGIVASKPVSSPSSSSLTPASKFGFRVSSCFLVFMHLLMAHH